MFIYQSELEFSISNWQCKLQCNINYGPEWNVEFSISIQTPYKHFDYLLSYYHCKHPRIRRATLVSCPFLFRFTRNFPREIKEKMDDIYLSRPLGNYPGYPPPPFDGPAPMRCISLALFLEIIEHIQKSNNIISNIIALIPREQWCLKQRLRFLTHPAKRNTLPHFQELFYSISAQFQIIVLLMI